MSIGRSGGRQSNRYWSRNVVIDVILFYNLAAILKKKTIFVSAGYSQSNKRCPTERAPCLKLQAAPMI
jgi:hypothetical protein